MHDAAINSIYYFIISNIYILFIFLYHYWNKRLWYIRYYIIGKTMQIAGVFVFEFFHPFHLVDSLHSIGLLIITGSALEIFSIISYDGIFHKKLFRHFIFTWIILLILLFIFRNQHEIHNVILDTANSFFFLYGGIILLKRRDKSRFRPLIGFAFILYATYRIVGLVILISENLSEVAMPGLSTPPLPLPEDHSFNFESTSQRFMYFVSVISSISYLIILKEQDELAIARINKQISKENKSLKALDEEKNKFFSIIAHDLKGPIGTLASISEMLVDKKSKLQIEDYEKWLEIIKVSTTRTYTFLNNLLQWARAESGNLVPHPVLLNVHDMVEEIFYLMETYAQNKQITLINNCPQDAAVFADKEMVLTVMRNLLSNAIKFTEKGGSITFAAKTGKLTTISVTDTGVGIDPEKAKKIFDLDSSLSSSGTQDEKGTGLGLKLSHGFIQKNNGEIWLKSEPGKGSTFYFSLPSKVNRQLGANNQ